MATKQPPQQPEQQIDVTAAEWLMIIVTGFTGIFAGPFAIIPGAVVVGMFTYRLNPELMKASKAGQWVRGFLPALAPEQEASTSPNSKPAATKGTIGQTQSATRSTALDSQSSTTARELKMIDLATLAKCSTILLVGSRGCGKSTLLRAILATKAAAKESTIAVYDPHAHPHVWPMAALLHNTEEKISNGLASAYKRLRARKHEMNTGVRIEGWPKITLAADEWGSIVSNVELPESIKKTPGQVSTELMKEGRKFGLGFVAGAHGFTNASLGCTGDQVAFMQSFDWIVNMGGYTRKAMPKEHMDLFDQIPLGTNEQGGTFPLIVLCESPTTGEFRLLDMRGIETLVDTRSPQAALTLPWETPQPRPDDTMLARLIDEGTSSHNRPQNTKNQAEIDGEPPTLGTGSQGGSPDTNAVEPLVPGTGSRSSGTGSQSLGTGSQSGVPDLELIAALVSAEWSANKIQDKVGGKRKVILSIVKQLKEGVSINDIRLDGAQSDGTGGDDDGSEPEGPFKDFFRDR